MKFERSDDRLVYYYIIHYIMNTGISPTQKEIARYTQESSYHTNVVLARLEKAKRIKKLKGKPRSISVVGMKHYMDREEVQDDSFYTE